jgi:hypothetical protein
MITSVVGIIYISTASVFGVSIVSVAKGFDPEQPMTFAIVSSLLVALIGVMAYSSKNKDRFEHMDIRFYRRSADHVESSVKEVLVSRTESYQKMVKGRRTIISLLDRKIVINIAAQPGNSTEVIIECADPKDAEVCDVLKRALDRTS